MIQINYTDEQPDEEIHRARSGRVLSTGDSVLLELEVCHPAQYIDVFTNLEALIIPYYWILWRLFTKT